MRVAAVLVLPFTVALALDPHVRVRGRASPTAFRTRRHTCGVLLHSTQRGTQEGGKPVLPGESVASMAAVAIVLTVILYLHRG